MRTSFSRRALFGSIAGVSTALLTLLLSGSAFPSEVGFLTVSSVPPAKVFIDDIDTGRSTPIEALALPPGNHRLRLEAGALKRALGFQITVGQTTRLKISL